MPRSEPQKAFAKAAYEHRHWDDSGWNHHDDAACDRAIKLLNRPSIGIHRVTDWFRGRRRRIAGSPWIGRTVVVLMSLGIIFAGCFGALWLRLGAGPVNLDVVTPWLASAIEENLGHDHTVQVGGTQIERAGRIRIAVRLRDIVVRDKASNIVASAPKAEVRLSGTALIMGRLRAETLRLVGAELAVRITPDGRVIVSTGQSNSPLATGKVPVKPEPQTVSGPPPLPFQASPTPPVPATSAAASNGTSGLLAALEWLDGLSAKGLDGQSLNEIGLRNGVLTVEDQRNGGVINFNNISLSLRRPLGGGAAFSVGEEGKNGWELKVAVGAPSNGVRSIDISATKVPTNNLLLAARLKDFTYAADMPLSGEFKGEIGRDGLPTYFRGEIVAGKGTIVDLNVPDYPMVIDHADARVEWDAGRRVMVAPFHVNAGANRITLLAHLEPPNDSIPNWQLGLSGGTILLAGNDGEAPSIFNRIAVRVRFDTENRRVLLTQCDISNGEIGIAGSGSIDYSGEARLRLGMAATPMPIAVLKRIWPVLIVPEVREWITERVDRGTVQRLDIAVNAPVHTLVRGGPPIPDDGLSVNFLANGLTVRPVDDMPLVRDADMKGRVSGQTVNINVGQGAVDTPAGRRLAISDLTFEVPDLAPKPAPTKVRFRIDGPVPAAAEVLQSERLREAGDTVIDPNSSKGTVSAIVTLAMPLKNALTKADTTYSISLDLGALAVDKLAMNQKLEANSLKVVADNQGYRVRGDVKIGGQPAALDYRKTSDGDADVRVSATLDDAARARLGVDLGQSLSGAIPIKLTGKIAGGEGDNRDNRFGVEADLTAARIDNLLPGWTKVAGKATKMTFNVIQKPQGTRFEDIVIDGNGTSIKGSLEIDDKNDLVNASFPTFAPSEGDKANLKAERQPDGMLKVTMRGEVFDGRGFIKSAMSGRDPNSKEKSKNFDIDIDAKLGALAGFYGEAVRSIDLKLTRRAGAIRSFSLSGKLGRDTPVIGDLRGRGQGQGQGRDVMYLETGDAGAFFRFTDTYAKMNGGKMWIAVDPPTSDTSPQEGLLNVRDFTIKGEAALDRAVANAPGANSQGVGFSGMRAEFTRQSGQLRVKDGVLRGPTIGATIEGVIDYPVNQVKMSGTFVPLYGLNNMFGQIPIVGLFLGGGSNEGLIGITYEVVGTPGAPVLRVNPISAMAPGVFRKIFDFNTGRQSVPTDFPTPQQ